MDFIDFLFHPLDWLNTRMKRGAFVLLIPFYFILMILFIVGGLGVWICALPVCGMIDLVTWVGTGRSKGLLKQIIPD